DRAARPPHGSRGGGRPPRGRAARAHPGGLGARRRPAAAPRALRALARPAHRAGPGRARLRADRAGRGRFGDRRRGPGLPALQHGGGPGAQARGHPGREPRGDAEPTRAVQVGALHPGAGGQRGPSTHGRRQSHASLRPAHRRWARGPRAPDPSRGLREGGPAMTGPASVSGARLAALLVGLGLVVALVAVGALFLGSARVPPGDVLAVLTGRVTGVDQIVVLSLRLPRILAALLAGGALA